MSLLNDVKRVKKLVRETLILEMIWEFPEIAEGDLRFSLEFWRELQGRTKAETIHLAEHGVWPDGTPSITVGLPAIGGSVVTPSKALQMVNKIAPQIPLNELRDRLVQSFDSNRRTPAEMDFFARHGYWPENGLTSPPHPRSHSLDE